jgi:hypothetical protein
MDRPGRGVRRFVYGFLAVFALCGLFSIELWPLTGWRLYSGVRTEERPSWRIVAVTPDGEERVDLGALPLGWHNTDRLLNTFPDLSEGERDEICDAWAQPLRRSGVEVEEVRIEQVTTLLSDPDAEPTAEPRYTCGT